MEGPTCKGTPHQVRSTTKAASGRASEATAAGLHAQVQYDLRASAAGRTPKIEDAPNANAYKLVFLYNKRA